jgi:hypothetical protein
MVKAASHDPSIQTEGFSSTIEQETNRKNNPNKNTNKTFFINNIF